MNPPLIRSLTIEIRSPETGPEIQKQNSKIENPTLDFVSSDETLDRYHEIISPSGWKLDSYLKNPVFQNAHQNGDILHTLGRALITEVRTIDARAALFQRIEFAVDANPIARLAFKLYQGSFLKAVSVGFIPIRWQDGAPSSSSSSSPSSSISFRRKYLEQELLEVSAVSIPANPNALVLAYKSGALEKSDLRDVADLCAQTLSVPDPQPSTLNPQPQLAATARLMSQLLKH